MLIALSEGMAAFWGAVLGGLLALIGSLGTHTWQQRSERAAANSLNARIVLACGQAALPLLNRAVAVGKRDEGQDSVQATLAELSVAGSAILRDALVAHAHLHAFEHKERLLVAVDSVAADLKLSCAHLATFDAVTSEQVTELYASLNALIGVLESRDLGYGTR